MVTLRQAINIIELLSPYFDVYFEGTGDGGVRLWVQEKQFTIIKPDNINI